MDATSPAFLQACQNRHIEPALAAAIVTVESGWNNWVCRSEPQFKWTWMVEEYAPKLGQSETTERTQQKTSWGLMQIMGGTARELGYEGLLSMLALPEMGLDWGLRYLTKKLRAHTQISDVIAAYNAGSPRRDPSGKYKNQAYVDKVMMALIAQKKVPA